MIKKWYKHDIYQVGFEVRMKEKIDNSCKNCTSLCQSIFNGLDEETLDSGDKSKIPNIFKKGQTLFLQGNPPFGIFCIKSGAVKVTQTDDLGKESIVRLCKSGDVVGHRSLLTNQSYQSTATAIEETKVCFFDKSHITGLINNKPQVSLNIIKSLGEDLGAAEGKISSFSQKNVRQRLAELLVILSKDHGQNVDGRIKITINLKREEMASMIGTAPETLIRFIAELRKESLIVQEGKTIFIPNIDALMDFAEIHD